MQKCEAYSPNTGNKCKREALFLYASRFVCRRCALNLIENGANPEPTKIKKKTKSVR